MSGKNAKLMLKDAREAIKTKDYEQALKLSKAVLKEDRNNYMALVFLGVSLQEVGPTNQAPNAFHKAIELDGTNVLAWNGLANYYEKINDDNAKKELITIYCRLLEIESAEKKQCEYCEKLEGLIRYGDYVAIIEVLYKVSTKADCTDKVKEQAASTILSITSQLQVVLPNDLMLIYENTLKFVCDNTKLVTVKYYADYLKVLYKQQKYDLLVAEAENMHQQFESDTISLEWLCKIYNEFIIEKRDVPETLFSKIHVYHEKLQKIEAKSPMALFTKSLLIMKDDLLKAKDLLKEVTNQRPGLLYAWIQLAECYLKLRLYKESLHAVTKAVKLLSSMKNPSKTLCDQVNALMLESYSRSADQKHWELALDLYKTMNMETTEVFVNITRTYINLGNFLEAEQCLDRFKNNHGINSTFFTLLKAQLLHKQGKLQAALDLLINETNEYECTDWWIEVGSLYWDLNLFKDSLVPFLKAAKLNPNDFVCFVNLGRCYQKFNNLDKARRCYEKAFKLNPKCSHAGIELSKIYRTQKNWDSNLALLKSITDCGIDADNYWAFFQLGLHFMEQNEYSKAIENFRYVIRVEPLNSYYWESLADAYLARGAYTSALKSYQRAGELTSNKLYSMLQIAYIKQLLGNYAESRSEYEHILDDNDKYVPALIGLAETCMHQARCYLKEQRLGSSRDAAQKAMDNLILAAKQHSELSCLWKLAGDSCLLVAKLPEKYSCMLVAAALVEGKDVDGNVALEKDELFVLAARCYCKALGLIEDNVLIWHDLAACYLSHAQNISDNSQTIALCEKSLSIARHCTKINPNNWQHWNLIGNVAVFQDPPDLALAQHAFIKAVTVEVKSAISWCNLGTLYLEMGDMKLANEAFSRAQRVDPEYVNSWIGQALIAELSEHEDAMDLFRHSTQLGMQQEGAIGYGCWVCKTILEAPLHTTIYSVHNMNAIPVACDALTWYTENNPNNACAWNMLGILKERMGLKSGACSAYKNALYLSEKDDTKDCTKVNYGRLLVDLMEYERAVDLYKSIKEATFSGGSGLALALFKNRQYEESYEAYESALHWLTDEQGLQSDLLVALASMAFMFQGPEAAKTLLFQSTQLEPPSPWGLYATLSLGLLYDDATLVKLVLSEMEKLKNKPQCVQHYAILLTYTNLIQGNYEKALHDLYKLVHIHPHEASLWYTLTALLLRLNEYQTPTGAIVKYAKTAIVLGRGKIDVTKILCMVSMASSFIGDKKQALITAQKAVHYYPHLAETWSVFISNVGVSKKLTSWIDFVQNNLKPTAVLSEWLKKLL